MNVEEKEAVIEEIIERELAMFLATPGEDGISECQTRPQSFRVMRWMTHCIHEIATLESYLQDLKEAEAEGRNFMIEKYARMDDRIPPLSDSPLLDVIAEAEMAFLTEAASLYPHAVHVSDFVLFRRYLRCELESLSERTLELYASETAQAVQEGRNPAVERYDNLWKRLGEGSLATYENKLAAQR